MMPMPNNDIFGKILHSLLLCVIVTMSHHFANLRFDWQLRLIETNLGVVRSHYESSCYSRIHRCRTCIQRDRRPISYETLEYGTVVKLAFKIDQQLESERAQIDRQIDR